MIIYITAGDGDFDGDFNSLTKPMYNSVLQKVHVIVTMSSLISELPSSSSKNSDCFPFILLYKYE